MRIECKFKDTCSRVETDECNNLCYPYVFLHSKSGNRGLYGATGVPLRYKDCLLSNLPIEQDNPAVYKVIYKYINDFDKYLAKGVGLFLFSIPNINNKFGTGTGKTTTAITLVNEYVLHAARQHLRGTSILKDNPALFIKAADFQNAYNGQFRGTIDIQQGNSSKFYSIKNKMKAVKLLVIDDIGIRNITEAFENELYEIIDYRVTQGLVTIYTSNIPLEELVESLGDRIVSRIDGSTYALGMAGQDYRKRGLF